MKYLSTHLFNKGLHQRYFSSKTIIRRVFDIGSGSIKCQVATVDLKKRKVISLLYNDSRQVLFLSDLKKSSRITWTKFQEGQKAISDQLIESSQFDVHSTAGIGTEVFRKAENGASTLAKYSQYFDFPIHLVSPQEEARFGFESARCLSNVPYPRLVSWDCGAGSFQMSSWKESHFDSQGSGTVYKTAQALQNSSSSPNPFLGNSLDEMLNILHHNLKTPPQWILNKENIFIGIGTSQSIFNQQRILGMSDTFTPEDVHKTMNELVGMSDTEIFHLEQMRFAEEIRNPHTVKMENAQYVIPKLALLLAAMRKCSIERLKFYQTNGNCTALLTDPQLWTPRLTGETFTFSARHTDFSKDGHSIVDGSCSIKSVHPSNFIAEELDLKQQVPRDRSAYKDDALSAKSNFLTVNWHLEKTCNYKCKFCFAHFEQTKRNLDLHEGFHLLDAFREAGFYKVNFAGGEPLLNAYLDEYLKYSKMIGLKTSIITNATKLTQTWLDNNGPFIDQIGISCDSLDDAVNKWLGRGFGNHVEITTRAFQRVREFNKTAAIPIKIKLNTVVTSKTYMEDWNMFLESNGVTRWKAFKVLKIKGENDHIYDELAITDEQFQQFVDRHRSLKVGGLVMAPEDNDDMTESYVMVSPDGRFYQNKNSSYKFSEPILQVGVKDALDEVGFDLAKFRARGGEYQVQH